MSAPHNPALEAKEAAHPASNGGRYSADGTIHDGHVGHPKHPQTKLEHGEQMMSEHERAALAEVGASSEYAPGTPERMRIEKRLKRKLDARFSILVSSAGLVA